MQLTILGSGAVRPNPGGATSGYLVEAGRTRLLVECGSGVVGRLIEHVEPAAADAVIVSHDHPDHWLDLVTLQMTLAYAPGHKRRMPLPVYLGPGAEAAIRGAGSAMWDDFWTEIEFRAFEPEIGLEIGDIRIEFAATAHTRPCWAMRFTSDGRSLVYTADTAPCPAVAALAEGADVLLSEATLGLLEENDSSAGHMTVLEAARLANSAGVGQLLLTHYFVENRPGDMVAAASQVCRAPVLIAKEGGVHDI